MPYLSDGLRKNLPYPLNPRQHRSGLVTWNYRVIKTKQPDGSPWYQMHEVYYSEDGIPNASTRDAVDPCGETKTDLLWTLDRMREATEKPALEWSAVANRFIDTE